MVDCYPRTPIAIAKAVLWVLTGVACFEVGRQLSWENVESQATRTQARDAYFVQKLKFRKSGGQEEF